MRILRNNFVVIAAVVVVLMILGVTTALAGDSGLKGSSDSHPQTKGAVLQRAAEILGIDVLDLTNALKHAKQEVTRQRVDQAIAKRLTHSVEAGGITQEQAEGAVTWWQSRPERVGPSLLARTYRPRFGPGLVLSPLVEHGKLTEIEADTIRTWWTSRPDYVEPALVLLKPHSKHGKKKLQRHHG